MKTFFLILCLITINQVYSQTFKVANLEILGLDEEEIQEKKKDGLGAKVELIFYEKSVKLTFYKPNKEKDYEVILDQDPKNKNEYIYLEKDDRHYWKISLTLNTIIYYIRSATLKSTYNKINRHGHPYKACSITATLKRENLF